MCMSFPTPTAGDARLDSPRQGAWSAIVRERARVIREIGQRLAAAFRASQVGSVHRGLTLEDGSLVVTGNYLKVRIPPGRARNEWVNVRLIVTAMTASCWAGDFRGPSTIS